MRFLYIRDTRLFSFFLIWVELLFSIILSLIIFYLFYKYRYSNQYNNLGTRDFTILLIHISHITQLSLFAQYCHLYFIQEQKTNTTFQYKCLYQWACLSKLVGCSLKYIIGIISCKLKQKIRFNWSRHVEIFNGNGLFENLKSSLLGNAIFSRREIYLLNYSWCYPHNYYRRH